MTAAGDDTHSTLLIHAHRVWRSLRQSILTPSYCFHTHG